MDFVLKGFVVLMSLICVVILILLILKLVTLTRKTCAFVDRTREIEMYGMEEENIQNCTSQEIEELASG